MAQSKVETGGCHDPKGKCRIEIEMCMALLQMLADSLRIWYTARRDTLLVRNKILEIYMLQLLQKIVHDSLPCVTSDLLGVRHSMVLAWFQARSCSGAVVPVPDSVSFVVLIQVK